MNHILDSVLTAAIIFGFFVGGFALFMLVFGLIVCEPDNRIAEFPYPICVGFGVLSSIHASKAYLPHIFVGAIILTLKEPLSNIRLIVSVAFAISLVASTGVAFVDSQNHSTSESDMKIIQFALAIFLAIVGRLFLILYRKTNQ